MLKKILAFVALMYALTAFAAVDVNKASAAELDGIKGIGPGISGKIVDERKKGSFKDWNDFIERVKGVGEVNAAKFSAEGMTVSGSSFKNAAASSPKAADAKPTATTTAAAASEAKKDAKAEAKLKADEAKTKAAADKQAKADAKKMKAEEVKAKKEAAKKAKDDAKMAKADAAKQAASAAKK